MMKIRTHALMIAAALVIPAGMATADTVTAKLDNVSPSQVVTIHYDGQNLGGAYAGSINWTETASSGATAPTGNFSTYCIDLTQEINIGHSYDYTIADILDAPNPKPPTASPSDVGMSANDAREIENLYAQEYDGIGTDNDKAAAFQISIWEMMYETAPTYDATSGNFYVTGASANVLNLVSSDVAAASASGVNLQFHNQILAMTSPTAQDQLFIGAAVPQGGPPAVPTPAAAMAGIPLLSALAITRKWRRRRMNEVTI